MGDFFFENTTVGRFETKLWLGQDIAQVFVLPDPPPSPSDGVARGLVRLAHLPDAAPREEDAVEEDPDDR